MRNLTLSLSVCFADVLPALLYGRATAAPWHSPVYLFLPLGAFIGLVGVHRDRKRSRVT
jgi:hypothetical protein